MLNNFSLPGTSDVDLYPPELAAEIDAVNDIVHNNVRTPLLGSINLTRVLSLDMSQELQTDL